MDFKIDANIKIDGLTIPKFTWAWFGIQIGEGVLQGIGGALFAEFLNKLFGGKTFEDTLAEQLRALTAALGKMMRELLTEDALRKSQALLVSVNRTMIEYVNAPKGRDRLELATNDSQALVAELESLGFPGYRMYMSAAGLRLAILQERAKLDQAERQNYIAARNLYIAHHDFIDATIRKEVSFEWQCEQARKASREYAAAHPSILGMSIPFDQLLDCRSINVTEAFYGIQPDDVPRKTANVQLPGPGAPVAPIPIVDWDALRQKIAADSTDLGAKMVERWNGFSFES